MFENYIKIKTDTMKHVARGIGFFLLAGLAVMSSAQTKEADLLDVQPSKVALPYIHPIAVIEPPELDAVGEVINADIEEFARPGFDVIGVACRPNSTDLAYRNDVSGFIELHKDGSGKLSTNEGGKSVEINVNADGSGTYDAAGDRLITVEVKADGSGSYYRSAGGTDVNYVVNADGSGQFEQSGDAVVDIKINADGSGSFYRLQPGGGILEVTANADGSGTYVQTQNGNHEEFTLESDGGYRYLHDGGSTNLLVELIVTADGSGSYHDADQSLAIEVAADGSGIYRLADKEHTFTTDEGILDPRLVTINQTPEFIVQTRLPRLETLPPLQPVCATVVRIPGALLFDFDSASLRPESAEILAQLATSLEKVGKPIEVHGHTDSKGDEDYNLNLSTKRATSVRNTLLEHVANLSITTQGYGESRPVAPNETAAGDDDPVGRQLNRRVEIVIFNGG